MTAPTTRPGRPVWVDLSTSDHVAARTFYGSLLGWDFDVSQDPQYGGYATASVDGKDVAGIGPAQPGAPTAWSLYVLTDNVGALAEKVAGAGGTVALPSMVVGDVGTMAVYQDPSGAFISAWQPNTMPGFHTGLPGSAGWFELSARGVERAIAFYRDAFGWTAEASPMPDGTTYTQFGLDGQNFAGAMEMQARMPAEVPSYWLVYFDVDDVAGAFDRALAAGGAQVVPPSPMPTGRFAVLRDPQGATFGIADDNTSDQSAR